MEVLLFPRVIFPGTVHPIIMNEQQMEALMLRYLAGTCTPEEKANFEAWLQTSEENRRQFYETRLIWHASRIEYFRSEAQLNKALGTFTGNVRQSQDHRRKRIFLQVARYAAIIIGALVITWIFLVRNPREKSTNAFLTASVLGTDSSKLVVLHDGTRVWLNNNSSITYPQQFSGNHRTVTLEGEAYFDVTHDAAHPFIIQTSSIQVKVLGTTFNLQAYSKGGQAEAVLVEGKIAIEDSVGQNLGVLIPGQLARFEKSNHSLQVENVNTEPYTAWRNGQIILTRANLKTITRKLSELYPVNFSMDPSLADTALFNFSFSKRKSISEVMEMLRFIAPIHYEVKEKEIVITP